MKKIISGILAAIFTLAAFAVPVMAVTTVRMLNSGSLTLSGSIPGLSGSYSGKWCRAADSGKYSSITVTGYAGKQKTAPNIKGASLRNVSQNGGTSSVWFRTLDSNGAEVYELSMPRERPFWSYACSGVFQGSGSTSFYGTVTLNNVRYEGAFTLNY